MTNKSPTWLINTLRAFPSKGNPPAFLAPTLASSPKRLPHQPHFSTTAAVCLLKRRRSVGNPHRGESALRRTGLRRPVGMSKEPLPQPVLDPKRRSKVQVDPNHGLWGFFNKNKKVLTPPQEDSAMGRAWTVEELRHKSWEDLHSLWYVCCKERNRLATEAHERKRMGLKAGDLEPHKRDMVVRRTQQRIKHTLTERWYSWQDAWKVAETDVEIDLNAKLGTPAYTPALQEEYNEEEPPRAASAVG